MQQLKPELKALMLDASTGFYRMQAIASVIFSVRGKNLFGQKDAVLGSIALTASRISSRNASVFWEPARNLDLVFSFLKNKKTVDGADHPELDGWLGFFD